MSDWTKEPWFVLPNDFCVAGPFEPEYADDPDQETAGIAHCGMRLRTNDEAAANAARIVSCVNFCQGTDSEYLDGAGNLGRLLATAGAGVNAELLAACKTMLGDVERFQASGGKLTDIEEAHVQMMRDAVEKAEGRSA